MQYLILSSNVAQKNVTRPEVDLLDTVILIQLSELAMAEN